MRACADAGAETLTVPGYSTGLHDYLAFLSASGSFKIAEELCQARVHCYELLTRRISCASLIQINTSNQRFYLPRMPIATIRLEKFLGPVYSLRN